MAGISLSDILSLCKRTPEQRGGRQWFDMFPVPLHGPASPPLSPTGFIPVVSTPWSIFMYCVIECEAAVRSGQRGINPPL